MGGWYIRRGEKIVGPVEIPKLQQLVAGGQLLASDQLAKDIAGPWKDAGTTTLFAKPPAVQTTPSALTTRTEEVPPAVIEPPRVGRMALQTGRAFFAVIGRGMLATFGAASRSMATRAQRKHEIKIARIHAAAMSESRRPIAMPSTQPPQIQQATVVKIVNKQSAYGCTGCSVVLLLILIGLIVASVISTNYQP